MGIEYSDMHGLDKPDATEAARDWPATWARIADMIDARLPYLGYANGIAAAHALGSLYTVTVPIPAGTFPSAPAMVLIGTRSGAGVPPGSTGPAVYSLRYRLDLSTATKIVFDYTGSAQTFYFTWAAFFGPLDV